MSTLTEGQRAYVRSLRERHPPVSWEKIAAELGSKEYRVRMEMDPAYKIYRTKLGEQARARLRTDRPPNMHRVVREESAVVNRNPVYDPLRDGGPVYRSPFSELLGEPPLGRSALDMRAPR